MAAALIRQLQQAAMLKAVGCQARIPTLLLWPSRVTNGSVMGPAYEQQQLNRIVKTASRIIGASLPFLKEIYEQRCTHRAAAIIRDFHHPSHGLFSLLPSGKRYRSISCRTTRMLNSFFAQAVRLEGPSPASLYDDSDELGVDGAEGAVPGDARHPDVVDAMLRFPGLGEDMAELALPDNSPSEGHDCGRKSPVVRGV
ncbi:hypothetical protein N1851_009834 [Merluccius polli]|uniref:Uncharacterized protein n=1 Tax=Merluccius polli TaxID=89951 RepID=A0AA47P3J7_MERPO|nr:hypothetical protein N1851_009834 [Merluccius polli]